MWMDFDGMKISLFVMFVSVFFIHKNDFQNKFCFLKRLCLKFYNIQEAERCCWKRFQSFIPILPSGGNMTIDSRGLKSIHMNHCCSQNNHALIG